MIPVCISTLFRQGICWFKRIPYTCRNEYSCRYFIFCGKSKKLNNFMQRAKNCKKKKVSFLVTKRANFHHVETQNTTQRNYTCVFFGETCTTSDVLQNRIHICVHTYLYSRFISDVCLNRNTSSGCDLWFVVVFLEKEKHFQR